MHYLLDTNIISEIRKSNPHRQVMQWFAQVAMAECYLSVITLGEIRRGIEKRRKTDMPYAKQLEIWLETLESLYKGRIWAFERDDAERWGMYDLGNGDHMVDAQIAATAHNRNAVLVTRNTKDFLRFGLKLMNPFESSSE